MKGFIVFFFFLLLVGVFIGCGGDRFGDDPITAETKTTAIGAGGLGTTEGGIKGEGSKKEPEKEQPKHEQPQPPVVNNTTNVTNITNVTISGQPQVTQPVNQPEIKQPEPLPDNVRNIQLFIMPTTADSNGMADIVIKAYGGPELQEMAINGISFDPADGFQLQSATAGSGCQVLETKQTGGLISLRIKTTWEENKMWEVCT